jgi:hypothetical protein
VVAEHDGFDAPEEIDQVEAAVGEGLQAAPEVIAQSSFSLHHAGTVLQQAESHGREQDDLVVIVREDSLQIVTVPCLNPFLSKWADEGGL